jgi:hypothetical protein
MDRILLREGELNHAKSNETCNSGLSYGAIAELPKSHRLHVHARVADNLDLALRHLSADPFHYALLASPWTSI